MNTLNVETVMPGHGDIGNNELLDTMKNYLTDLEISAQNLIDKNHSIDDIESISPPKKYSDWWFDRFYEPNLRFAYQSLISEPAE